MPTPLVRPGFQISGRRQRSLILPQLKSILSRDAYLVVNDQPVVRARIVRTDLPIPDVPAGFVVVPPKWVPKASAARLLVDDEVATDKGHSDLAR